MGKSDEKHNNAVPRFSEEQYKMLLRCSKKKDMTEWNEWRKKNQKEDVLLEGVDLAERWLKGVFLGKVAFVTIKPDHKTISIGGDVYLEGAHIKGADLEKADLRNSHLESVKFNFAHLQRTDFLDAHLKGTIFYKAHLDGASLRTSIVDGETSFWECYIDRDTDFRGVGLGGCRIDPGTKQLLEYNIRRMNWEDWYKEHWLLKWLVKPFWLMSNYGRSTAWIVAWFFGLAAVFALVYWLRPGCLIVRGEVGYIRGFVHALYFSIVTMTTLGFGDIAANPDSWGGQVLLMFQVILGYVLLGALVTRFAVLFTAGGPAGKFAKKEKRRRAGDG